MVYCESCEKSSKPFKVLILHGTWGSGEGNWFPWLKRYLGEWGIEVANPTLPDAKLPDYKERMTFLEKEYGDFIDENTIIIGHSSGAPTAWQLAEKKRVRGLVLVAPVLEVDEAMFLNEAALKYPQTAIKALYDESLRLLQNTAYMVIVNGLNVHRKDLESDRSLTELIEASTPIDVDFEGIYLRKIKTVFGDILEFATQTQSKLDLTADEVEKIRNESNE